MNAAPTRILILSHYSSANRGDAAILSGLIELLGECFATPRITVSSSFPQLAEQIHRVPSIPPIFETRKGYDARAFYRSYNWAKRYGNRAIRPFAAMHLPPDLQQRLRKVLNADIVIGAGGTYLNDNYYPDIIGRLHELDLARCFHKPVLLLGHSIGPFSHVENRSVAGRILSQVNGIAVRDPASMKVLIDLGVPEATVHLTGDTALFSPVLEPHEIRPVLEAYLPNFASTPLVSVSVRKWQYYKYGSMEQNHEQYVSKIAVACDHVVSQHGGHIVFLSTCTSLGGYGADDREVAEDVKSRMRFATQATVIGDELTSSQLAGLYGFMHLHIGTRMHSIILAAMGGTPSVAIAYEFKTTEYMELMRMSDYALDIDSFEAQELIRRIDLAFQNRRTLAKQVEERLAHARHLAQRNLALIKTVSRSALNHPRAWESFA